MLSASLPSVDSGRLFPWRDCNMAILILEYIHIASEISAPSGLGYSAVPAQPSGQPRVPFAQLMMMPKSCRNCMPVLVLVVGDSSDGDGRTALTDIRIPRAGQGNQEVVEKEACTPSLSQLSIERVFVAETWKPGPSRGPWSQQENIMSISETAEPISHRRLKRTSWGGLGGQSYTRGVVF
jgi:hypothetical protein